MRQSCGSERQACPILNRLIKLMQSYQHRIPDGNQAVLILCRLEDGCRSSSRTTTARARPRANPFTPAQYLRYRQRARIPLSEAKRPPLG